MGGMRWVNKLATYRCTVSDDKANSGKQEGILTLEIFFRFRTSLKFLLSQFLFKSAIILIVLLAHLISRSIYTRGLSFITVHTTIIYYA